MDFGAGIGTLALMYKDRTGVSPTCIEIDPHLVRILQGRGLATFRDLDDLTEEFEAVYSSNVLEHIEDDLATLKRIRRTMTRGAVLVLYLPAFQCLYTGLDVAVGHYRRYGKRELSKKLQASGFEISHIHFADSIGFFILLLIRLANFKKTSVLSSSGNFSFYDKFVFPVSRLVDTIGVRHLFGKNIVVKAVAR